MAWYEDPDPYTYERIGIDRVHDRPVYLVLRDGVRLGIIEPSEVNTDRPIAGTRLRHVGKGHAGFRPAARRDERRWMDFDRRRDAARNIEESRHPWSAAEIDAYIERISARA